MTKTMTEAGWTKTYPDVEFLNNPSESDLRALAKSEEHSTHFGAPGYYTRQAASRGAAHTYVYEYGVKIGRFQKALPAELVPEMLNQVSAAVARTPMMSLDRVIGSAPESSFHCRLLIPKAFARIGYMWSKLLFPADKAMQDPRREPDFLTVYLPNWLDGSPASEKLPKKLIVINPKAGITYVLGSDYVGEAKMSFLRQAMYRAKTKGGMGLHAGSKVVTVKTDKGLQNCGMLLFGLSGTGKTTLTLEDHHLSAPEGVTVLQDDIALWMPNGKAYGTENNFYVKTEGLKREDQPGLYDALMSPQSIFENITVDSDGKVLFDDFSHGTNGRALVLRSRVPHSGPMIDLERVDKLIFITRRDTIVPPVARLTAEQAAAFFMLGESIETSAGDPTKAGQPKHEVGFNPFIVGPEDEEGNQLYALLKANPKTEVYLLNTGNVGKGSDIAGGNPQGLKITKEVSSRILAFIARQTPGSSEGWEEDPNWKYQVPTNVPGISLWKNYSPKRHYKAGTYSKLTRELRELREKWLSQFPGLKPEIRASIS